VRGEDWKSGWRLKTKARVQDGGGVEDMMIDRDDGGGDNVEIGDGTEKYSRRQSI
jgi:hypothetical protein